MAGMCFIAQLIEHLPESVLIGRRRQGGHVLHSSVDRALTRECLIGRRRQGRHVLHSSVDKALTRECLDWTKATGQACAS